MADLRDFEAVVAQHRKNLADMRKSLPAQIEDGMRSIRPLLPPPDGNLASEFHKRLSKWIVAFDAELDSAHEVGVRLVSFGQTVIFHLEDLGYWNPSLIVFHGHSEDGSPVQIMQHVSQISLLLMKMKRPNPEEPKRPFGFAAYKKDSDELDGSDPVSELPIEGS